MPRRSYSMPVWIDQNTECRFHCVCDYWPCRCDDDVVQDGVIISVWLNEPHTYNPDGTFTFCNVDDCVICLNALPF